MGRWSKGKKHGTGRYTKFNGDFYKGTGNMANSTAKE